MSAATVNTPVRYSMDISLGSKVLAARDHRGKESEDRQSQCEGGECHHVFLLAFPLGNQSRRMR
jgi:hypothetical protein